MALVKLHEASDGSYHKDFKAFAQHEEALKITAAIGSAALENGALETIEGNDGETYVALPVESIAKFVVDNAATLRKILADSVVTARGRAASKGKGKSGRKPKATQPAPAPAPAEAGSFS